jgi:hypothetical protein
MNASAGQGRDLAALQRDFQAWLVHPSDAIGRRLGPPARLAVYQNNYRTQLVNCLQASYPQVRGWLGEEVFLAAAVSHIDSRPPHDWTLDAYADGFPDALAEAFPDNPDLHELAWIEHALQAAFVARDSACDPAADWSRIDWELASVRFAPSMRLRPALTNAGAIWEALADGSLCPASEMLAEPAGLLVWRHGHQCVLRQLDGLEYEALLRLRQDGSFGGLCEWLVERVGEARGVEHAGTFLGGWLAGRIVIGTDDDPPDEAMPLTVVDGENA